MFTENELDATKKVISAKMNDIRNNKTITDEQYLRDMQTLIVLQQATEKEKTRGLEDD